MDFADEGVRQQVVPREQHWVFCIKVEVGVSKSASDAKKSVVVEKRRQAVNERTTW